MTITETHAYVAEIIGPPNLLGRYEIPAALLNSAISLAHAAGGMDQAQKTMRRLTQQGDQRRSINADVPELAGKP